MGVGKWGRNGEVFAFPRHPALGDSMSLPSLSFPSSSQITFLLTLAISPRTHSAFNIEDRNLSNLAIFDSILLRIGTHPGLHVTECRVI